MKKAVIYARVSSTGDRQDTARQPHPHRIRVLTPRQSKKFSYAAHITNNRPAAQNGRIKKQRHSLRPNQQKGSCNDPIPTGNQQPP